MRLLYVADKKVIVVIRKDGIGCCFEGDKCFEELIKEVECIASYRDLDPLEKVFTDVCLKGLDEVLSEVS